MSRSDDISALPGGEALAALLAQVSGSPARILELSGRWRLIATGTGDRIGRLSTAVTSVDGAWQGTSADAFRDHMGLYGTAGGELCSALTDCATALEGSAAALSEAETGVGAVCDDVLVRAANLRTNNPSLAEEDINAAIAAMVDSAVAAAQPYVTDAGTAVTGAMAAINARLGERTIQFADIGAPSEANFTGEGFDWQPTPGIPDPGISDPAGADPGISDPAGSDPSAVSMAAASGSTAVPAGSPAPPGEIRDWIEQAIEILRQNGYPVELMNVDDIYQIIMHESGGNPSAINDWDSNAAAGIPSKGLMQTIDSTFQANKLPGHDDIYNPVDNIIAAVRYAIDRYGSVSNVPGIVNLREGTDYRGY